MIQTWHCTSRSILRGLLTVTGWNNTIIDYIINILQHTKHTQHAEHSRSKPSLWCLLVRSPRNTLILAHHTHTHTHTRTSYSHSYSYSHTTLTLIRTFILAHNAHTHNHNAHIHNQNAHNCTRTACSHSYILTLTLAHNAHTNNQNAHTHTTLTLTIATHTLILVLAHNSHTHNQNAHTYTTFKLIIKTHTLTLVYEAHTHIITAHITCFFALHGQFIPERYRRPATFNGATDRSHRQLRESAIILEQYELLQKLGGFRSEIPVLTRLHRVTRGCSPNFCKLKYLFLQSDCRFEQLKMISVVCTIKSDRSPVPFGKQ